jgi:Fur family transcriptional regulator, ferric uptake regulator
VSTDQPNLPCVRARSYTAGMTSSDNLAALLNARGYRATGPRRQVLDALVRAKGHRTAEQLCADIASRGTKVDLASVYRTLTLFDELGLARASRLHDDAAEWELTGRVEHVHLICRGCGDVHHHAASLAQAVKDHVSDDHAFTVESLDVTVYGRCAACSA